MPDFAEDQKGKAELPRLPWLVKNQELSAVPVELNKLQPGWSDGVIQDVPRFSLSSGTVCYPTWAGTLSRAPQTAVKALMTAVFPSEPNFY